MLPYHNPLHIAKEFATLDALSGGRVILGVGIGHLRPEFEVLKVPFEERGAIANEYIDIIKLLWEQEYPSFSGRYFSFQEVTVSPRPMQKPRPPIWVGGITRVAIRRAVERGDGWLPNYISREGFKALVEYGRSLPAYAQREKPLAIIARIGPNLRDLKNPEAIAQEVRAWREAGATGYHIGYSRGGLLGFATDSLEEVMDAVAAFADRVFPLLE